MRCKWILILVLLLQGTILLCLHSRAYKAIHSAQPPQFVLYSRSGRVVLVPDHAPCLDIAELAPCTKHTSMITGTGKQRLFLPDMLWGRTQEIPSRTKWFVRQIFHTWTNKNTKKRNTDICIQIMS